MKKYLKIFLLVLLMTGCGKEKVKEDKKEVNNEPIIVQEDEKQEEYVDLNPMPISFYTNGVKDDGYEAYFEISKDIAVFQIFPSNEEYISYNGSYANSFYEEWMKYDPYHSIKIGYNLKYTTSDGNQVSHNVFSPSDSFNFLSYIIVFMYDDYANRGKSWYSHIEEDEYNDDTFMSSIKVYANGGAYLINSDIILTVFTYDSEDDFDPETHEYRGNSKHSITIKNKGLTN